MVIWKMSCLILQCSKEWCHSGWPNRKTKTAEIALKVGIDFECSDRAVAVHRGMEQFFCFNEGYPMDIDFKCSSAWLQQFNKVWNNFSILMKDIPFCFYNR